MYIENNITRNKFLHGFFLCLSYCIYDSSWWFNQINRLWFIYNKMELFSGVLPPLNDQQWNNYFDEYKLIPEFKLQNYT